MAFEDFKTTKRHPNWRIGGCWFYAFLIAASSIGMRLKTTPPDVLQGGHSYEPSRGFNKIDQMAFGEDFFAKQCWDMIKARVACGAVVFSSFLIGGFIGGFMGFYWWFYRVL